MCELCLTRDAQRAYQQADIALVRKLHRCFDNLCRSPYEHPNIRRLKGPPAGCYRYRVGDWRVVYRVEEERKVVIVVLIVRRGEAYR